MCAVVPTVELSTVCVFIVLPRYRGCRLCLVFLTTVVFHVAGRYQHCDYALSPLHARAVSNISGIRDCAMFVNGQIQACVHELRRVLSRRPPNDDLRHQFVMSHQKDMYGVLVWGTESQRCIASGDRGMAGRCNAQGTSPEPVCMSLRLLPAGECPAARSCFARTTLPRVQTWSTHTRIAIVIG